MSIVNAPAELKFLTLNFIISGTASYQDRWMELAQDHVLVSKFNIFFQPHGPVTLRSRGRGASSRTSQEEGESKHSAAIEHQQQQQSSCQQQDDDELPLARVRDDALARKACVSFAYCYLVKILIHFGHQLYKVCYVRSIEWYNLKSNCW